MIEDLKLYLINNQLFIPRVPGVIGLNGWKKIVDFGLNEAELAEFNKSADAVRNMNDVLKTL